MKMITRLAFVSLFLSFSTLSSFAQSGIISTYVGTHLPVDGALATTQIVIAPTGVVADGAGGFYVSSGASQVYRVTSAGVIRTVAGNGNFGFSGDGGPAASATINFPDDVAVDEAGNLYIADASNNRIRKVTPGGVISTVAGTGAGGFSGDGGPATSAALNFPAGVAVDSAGNLYIADESNNRIRKVTPGGVISTVAGSGARSFSGDGGPATSAALNFPVGVAVDAAGNLYIADTSNSRIRKVTPGGVISTVAGSVAPGFSGDGGAATSAQLNFPTKVSVDAAGNLYIADTSNNRIRKVTTDGVIRTVAGNGSFGFSGEGGSATSVAISEPDGVSVDAAGNLYIADYDNYLVRKVTPDGIISSVTGSGVGAFGYPGDGGQASIASLSYPYGVATDATGNLYIADSDNSRIRKVTPGGVISTVAGNGGFGFSGDGGPAKSAMLNSPIGVAVDAAGNLFIADSNNNRVRKVTPGGVISTVAGNGAFGFSGDGGPATLAALNFPTGIAVDSAGNLYIADSPNNRIRKVTADGVISTFAGNAARGFSGDGGPATSASLNFPYAVAVDVAGNLYIADSSNNRIRKVTPDGVIRTFAGSGASGFSGDGGPATSASLGFPYGVAVDAAGNVYFTDSRNSRVRRVTLGGTISTVAGSGVYGIAGDGGLAISAQLAFPTGIAVDTAGNLYISDSDYSNVRKVDLSSNLPTIANITPGSGVIGTAVNLIVSGTNLSTPLVINTISGITVSNLAVIGATSVAATFTISPGALLGASVVTVTTSNGTSNGGIFTVTSPPPAPTLTSITPGSGGQGGNISVTLSGTNFISGQSINAGTGIAVSNLAVFNSTLATATFSIASTTALGAQSLNVTTSGGTSNSLTFTVGSPSLTLSNSGTGSGTVSSSPAGIDCGATCSTTFTPGQVFALTATPAPGSIFGGWSGDGDCLDGSVTMTAARNCVARFDLPQSYSTNLRGDFDGDGKTDIAVFRPATGEWFLRLSTQGYAFGTVNSYFQWGMPGDLPVVGDFDGDRKTDIAVFRPPTHEWFLRLSSRGYTVGAGNWYFQWGLNGDVPVTGDFDGDQKTDIAVYRPSTGEWFLRLSTQNYTPAAGNWYFQWGQASDVPIVCDFDGDGKADLAVFRPSTGEWFIRLSTRSYAVTVGNWYYQWGVANDQPVVGDFDGDGKADIAVYRPSTGEWFLRLSSQNYNVGSGNWYFQWGLAGDRALVGDFDGDGKSDITIYRPLTGDWFLRQSSLGYAIGVGSFYFQWGLNTDFPLTN